MKKRLTMNPEAEPINYCRRVVNILTGIAKRSIDPILNAIIYGMKLYNRIILI